MEAFGVLGLKLDEGSDRPRGGNNVDNNVDSADKLSTELTGVESTDGQKFRAKTNKRLPAKRGA